MYRKRNGLIKKKITQNDDITVIINNIIKIIKINIHLK